MASLASSTSKRTKRRATVKGFTNLGRAIAEKEINSFSGFIAALARKFTSSSEEAEAAKREIMNDIWLFSQRGEYYRSSEDLLASVIARRRLMKYLQ